MALPTEDNIYGYDASKAAAVVAAILNGILFIWHGYLSLWTPRTLRHKHRYTIPLFVAAFFATAGYAIRIASVSDPSSVPLYAQSSSWIVLSPIFVCAMLYWQMKYLVLLLLPPGPQQRLFGVNPLWLGRIFITSDVLSFLTQGAGSGIAASGGWEGNTKDIGEGVMIGGLCLQLLTFTIYSVFMFRLVNRVHSSPQATFIPGVKLVLIGVTIAAVFVQIRTVFRLAEFAVGIEGYLMGHEWCLYVLESLPMFLALSALAWFHPVKNLLHQRYYGEDKNAAGNPMISKEGYSPVNSDQAVPMQV